MTSKNKNGSLNAEEQKFSNINSHWHLSYLRLKKNRYGMFGLYGVLFIFFSAGLFMRWGAYLMLHRKKD